jgi:hypothetical protein
MQEANDSMSANAQDWIRLIECAGRIKQLAPWQWMREDNVFGVVHPETGEIGFISVMGALGEHLAVAVYLGASALAKFFALQQAPPGVLDEHPELLLEIPQLQASFEDRGELEDWDRQLLRGLNLKFRGRKAWPRFRSFRPGFMPWRLEPEEIGFLTMALEQLEQVAPRLKENRSFLSGEAPGTLLIRSCRARKGNAGEWQDRYERVPPPNFPPVPLAWDPGDVKKLKRMPAREDVLEVDFFQFPGAIGQKGDRPQAGYILLSLHAPSNLIFGAQTTCVTESIEHMWGQIPGLLLSRLVEPGLRPREIHVQSRMLQNVLQPAFKELGTQVVLKPVLKKLRAAKRELMAHFERNPLPARRGR